MIGAEDVLEEAIKSSVKVSLTYVDKVVVVCSGRIEGAHADSINKFLQWLSFSRYKDMFVFVYNKADLVQDHATREENLFQMCDLFRAEMSQNNEWLDWNGDREAINMNLTTAFPPNASYSDIKSDHEMFAKACLCAGKNNISEGRMQTRRIPVDKSSSSRHKLMQS